jgi:hypothetical protein
LSPARPILVEDVAVDPHTDPDRERHIVEAASQALAAMNGGPDEAAAERVTEAFRANPTSVEDAREMMSLLFRECSGMVAALGSGGTAPVKMQVYDNDGQEVPIDEADPPVRTAVRTLLAEVHGDSEAAKTHIEIALANAAPEEMVTLMVQALRWTIRLSAECTSRDLPVADWIRTALS